VGRRVGAARRHALAAAETEAGKELARQLLSAAEIRYISGCVNAGWPRPPAAGAAPPPLDVSGALADGTLGVPSYPGGGVHNQMIVNAIMGRYEMLVWNKRLYVEGRITAGLAVGSIVRLKETYFVDGTKSYRSALGQELVLPRLVAVDVVNINKGLDGAEVRKWFAAVTRYRGARAKAEEARLAQLAEALAAQAARKAEEQRKAQAEAEAKAEKERQAKAAAARKAEQEKRDNPATLAKFNRIEDGMTYEQVKAIMGVGGEHVSHVGVAGTTADAVAWKNQDGSNMLVTFSNGRVAGKAQFGLR
jgi:hypothetical protein